MFRSSESNSSADIYVLRYFTLACSWPSNFPPKPINYIEAVDIPSLIRADETTAIRTRTANSESNVREVVARA
jgi:hypothetical protein